MLAGWRYQVGWKPVTGLPAAVLTGTWLVITAAGGEPDAEVAAALTRHGAQVITVPWDTTVTDRSTAAQWLHTR